MSTKPPTSKDDKAETGTDLTTKQEKFCQVYILTGVATVAYKVAYNTGNMKDATIHREAHELMNHPKITTRLKQLQNDMLKRFDVSVDSLTAELLQTILTARMNGQLNLVPVCVDKIARMHGFMTQKHEHELSMTEKVMRDFFKLPDTTGLPAQHLPKHMLNHPDLQRPDGGPGRLDDDYINSRKY